MRSGVRASESKAKNQELAGGERFYPVVILYPIDPRTEKLGGIETSITSRLSRRSPERPVKLVGVDAIGNLETGRWNQIFLQGKKLDFFPLFVEKELNRRTFPPLNLRFICHLWKNKSRIMREPALLDFHRVDHLLPFWADRRSPVVLTIHGTSKNIHLPNESLISKVRPLFLLVELLSLRRADRIFCVSDEGVRHYRRRLPANPGKVRLLENGVDFELFGPQNPGVCRRLFRLPEDKKILLFVGRLEKVKDPDLLLQTFRELKIRRPDIVLVLAGDGSERDDLLVRHSDLKNELIFLGAVPHARMPELFSAADCLLLTSHFEGMPRAVLEALAGGLPVVSTNVGDVSKIVQNGHSGFVVPSRNAKDLADRVQALLDRRPTLSDCRSALAGYEAGAVWQKIERANQETARSFYG